MPGSKVIAIRSGMGLGDALYLQSVARHFVGKGFFVEVCSKWNDVFRPLGDKVRVVPFRRDRIDRLAHYSMRKKERTDQFEDCCIQAGIREPVEMRLDWQVINRDLVAALKAHGKPIVLVQLPREPMDRTDGYGRELLPDCRAIQKAIDALKGKALLVQIGAGKPLFAFSGIDVDLVERTSVSDVLDLGSACDGVLGYVSFLVPLAESFSRPGLFVWARRGLSSKTEYIRLITPEKILHKRTSRAVFDDCTEDEIVRAAHALLDAR